MSRSPDRLKRRVKSGLCSLISAAVLLSQSCGRSDEGTKTETNADSVPAHAVTPPRYMFKTLVTRDEHTFCTTDELIARILAQDIMDQQAEKFRKDLHAYQALGNVKVLNKGVPVKYLREVNYNDESFTLKKFILISPPEPEDACWVTAFALLEAEYTDATTGETILIDYGANPANPSDSAAMKACYDNAEPCIPK